VGLRDTLNNTPRVVTGATVIMILIVGYLIYANLGHGPAGGPAPAKDMVYFSDDDGKSYFADDAKKIPPFNHDGKEAVRARVYRSGGKTYVNHLERYTPESKKKLEGIIARAKGPDVMLPDVGGVEVKAPGGSSWVSANSPEAASVMAPRFPSADLQVVTP
jgi:hypothetical protein